MKIDKRKLTKFVVNTTVISASTRLIVKTVHAIAPSTEDNLLVDIGAAVAGWYVGEKSEPITDKVVDDFFDKREIEKTLTA